MFFVRSLQLSSTRPLLRSNFLLHTHPTRSFASSAIKQANPNSQASQVISEVSKQEGGTYKGSKASQLQSEITKQRNASPSNAQRAPDTMSATNAADQNSPTTQSHLDREANYIEAVDKVGTKMSTDPTSISKEDADLLHSRDVRAHGASEKGGLASQAQSQAAENMGTTKGTGGGPAGRAAAQVSPDMQSQLDREANLAEAADQIIGEKMERDPGSVTKEDADLLHSREQRAHGRTEKGGMASQAQSQVAENEGVKK